MACIQNELPSLFLSETSCLGLSGLLRNEAACLLLLVLLGSEAQ